MYRLVAFIFFAAVVETYGVGGLWEGEIAWDHPDYSDKGCTFPKGIFLPWHMYVAIVEGITQKFDFHLSMANSPYYRFQYEKIKNVNSSSVEDVKKLQPRVIFPNFPGLVQSFPPSYARAYFLNSVNKYFYKVLCIPLNLALSNATCQVIDQNEGAKGNSFGTGVNVATTIIHYDLSDPPCYTEYHCFQQADGSRSMQIFNVISKGPKLNPNQIRNITDVVVACGFNKDNIIVYQDLLEN